jgi:hypothetical protein
MNERLNPRGLPFYEAVALKGVGVEETLKGATALVFRSLAARYGGPGTTAPGKTEGPGTKPPMPGPGSTGPLPRPAAAAPVASAPPPRAVPSQPAPARSRPPAAATATLPPTPGGEEDVLESLELQPEEEELSLEVDDSEVLDNTNPTPQAKPGHDTVARSGPETDELRDRLRQPPASVQFEPIEEDAEEEISLDPPDPEPARPDPPRRLPEAARGAETPRPAPPVRLPNPTTPTPAPRPVPTTAPVSIEVKPGTPAEAEVAIPVQLMVGGRMTQVQINVRLVLDLKFPK